MQALPTLRQLQFFVALVRRRSFSRAAEDCLVSQSTLSAAIKELETVLLASLVDRTSRTFALTPVGEALVEPATQLLAKAGDMVRMANRSAPLCGVLRLGVIPTIAPYLLPGAMQVFNSDYEDLSLYLREDKTQNLIELLYSGQIDLALMAFPYEADGVEFETFAEDPFWFVCTPEHRLSNRKKIDLTDIHSEELLLLEDGHCLRDHALSACHLQDKEIRDAFGATSLFTLAQMVKSGLGATLLPDMALTQGIAARNDLVAVPFKASKKYPGPSRQIGIAWREGASFRQDAEAMIKVFAGVLG